MSQNNEDIMKNDNKNKLISEGLSNENTIFALILFVLVINLLNRKNIFSDSNLQDEEYTVVMRENPAFPLEETEKFPKKERFLDVRNHQDLFSMMNRLKPYMSIKNQRVVGIFEKWQLLMRDIDELSYNFNNQDIHSQSLRDEPKNLAGFLSDIKPFIHKDYHYQIEEFSDHINSILNIEKNIANLQNTFSSISNISDNDIKLNKIIDSLHPFMDKKQIELMEKLKKLYRLMDIMNMTEELSPKTSEENSNRSHLMEMLNIFDEIPKDDKTSQGLVKNNDNGGGIAVQKVDFIPDQEETIVYKEGIEGNEALENIKASENLLEINSNNINSEDEGLSEENNDL